MSRGSDLELINFLFLLYHLFKKLKKNSFFIFLQCSGCLSSPQLVRHHGKAGPVKPGCGHLMKPDPPAGSSALQVTGHRAAGHPGPPAPPAQAPEP